VTNKSDNVVWHKPTVTREKRERLNGHKSFVVWFTGLSGSGKSTLAHALEDSLHQKGCRTFVLDGDNVRHGLSSNLTFSEEDRKENIRRIGEAAKLMVDAGVIALTAFISPFRVDREMVRSMFPHGDFIEVYVRASLEACEARDVKGLYAKARAGEIKNYTGIDSPYEESFRPEVTVATEDNDVKSSVEKILGCLKVKNLV